jgi:hypothetical protein
MISPPLADEALRDTLTEWVARESNNKVTSYNNSCAELLEQGPTITLYDVRYPL